jgi:hypothetical protein
MTDPTARVLAILGCAGFWFFLPFTQYRVASVGISEAMGVVAGVALFLTARVPLASESLVAFSVHVLFTFFTFSSAITGYPHVEGLLRDVIAVSYSVFAAICIGNLMATWRSALVASMYAVIIAVLIQFLALLLAVIMERPTNVWWEEQILSMADAGPSSDGLISALPRFVGFAQNPNQLAIFVVFGIYMVAAAVHLRLIGIPASYRNLFYLGGVVVVLSTQSDAGLLSLMFGIGLIASRSLLRSPPALRASFIYLVACCSALVGWWTWEWGLGEDAGGGRLALWITSSDVIDTSSGWGLGYGAHIPTSIGLLESHSTVLDFVLSGGFLGGVMLVLICLWFIVQYIRLAGDWILVPSLTAFCFLLTYSGMRNPIFWISLLLPRVLDISLRARYSRDSCFGQRNSSESGPVETVGSRASGVNEGVL